MPSPLDHRIPPPIVGAVIAAAMWSVSGAGPVFAWPVLPKYVMAGVVAAAGIAFDLMGLLAFRASRTTINPLKPQRATALVTGGVYRITRNPMYLGLALLLLAWAVHLAALLPYLGPVLLVLYVTRFQIQPEERVLQAKFGQEYAAYAARVRRWL